MIRRLSKFLGAAAALAFAAAPVQAALVSAGTLFVDLDARHPTAGTATWTNTAGGAVGNFNTTGAVSLSTAGPLSNPAVNFPGGVNDAYVSTGLAPAGLVGANPTRSIEVWTFNPTVSGEETLVAWSRRGGPDGTNMSFNYGADGSFGAVGHWGGGPDMGWGGSGSPAAGQWHHLVYVHDGTNTRVYQDGVLKNVENHAGILNTHNTNQIAIGTQFANAAGALTGDGVRLTGQIANVRVHDGALSAADVATNFLNDSVRFGVTALSPVPAHRYSFDGNANDSIGGAHGTVIGGATFAGGQLNLNNPPGLPSGGAGNFVSLPTSVIAGKTSATIEGWGTFSGNANWARLFDFGDEVLSGNEGRQYIFLTLSSGPGDTRLGVANPAGNSPGFTAETQVVVGGTPLNSGQPIHFAAVYDDATDRLELYINGVLAGTVLNGRDVGGLNFVNAWLGRALYDGDSYLQGSYDEFRIYNTALSSTQILGNFIAGPNQLNAAAVPEPASALLGVMGLAGLAMRRRRAA